VTEVSAMTGALVHVMSSHRFGFDNPNDIAVAGKNAWVANGAGDSVSELSMSSGALIRFVS